MSFKFENLEVWKLSLEYVDKIYEITGLLPVKKEYKIKTLLKRSATSVSLNIAEDSTSQSDPESSRFLGLAIRSCIEVVVCLHLAKSRGYIDEKDLAGHMNSVRKYLPSCKLYERS